MRTAILSTLLPASATTLVNCDAAPEHIFVADYTGEVHTVEYTPNNTATNNTATNSNAKLTLLHTSGGCESRPTWLFKGLNKERLWCVDEGQGQMGSINRLAIAADGSLNRIGNSGPMGGVQVQASFAFNNTESSWLNTVAWLDQGRQAECHFSRSRTER